MSDIVRDGAVISLAYTLRLENGDVVDYSEAEDPLEYLHGAENIIPGLERELTGLRVGDSKDVEVEPADGYGMYDPEDVELIERGMLPKGLPLKLGMHLAISDDEGNMSEAIVREIRPDGVTLDFNHPLAGQKLFFSVEVVNIREATAEELEHGHPHFDDDEFEDDDEFDFEDDDELDEPYDELDFEDDVDEEYDDEDDAPDDRSQRR